MKRIRQALARLSGKKSTSDSDGGDSSSASLRKQHSPVDPSVRRSHSRSYHSQTTRAPSTDRLLHPTPLPSPNLAAVYSRTGPVVIYDGLIDTDPDEGVDIVFVHCLGGERIASWEKDGVCWPRDLLPHDIPKSRVIMCGYATPEDDALRAGNVPRSPFALGADILKDLARMRDGVTRNIILIGHGLGGLIIKEALTMASVDRVYGKGAMGDLYPKTTGIVFLGTPHISSGRRTLGDVIGAAALLDYPQMSNELLHLLRSDSETWETQRSEFLLISRDVQVVCVREQIPTADTQMVPRAVATYEGINVTTDDVRADHMNIARFSSRQDAGYFQLIGHISKLSRGTPQEEVHSRRIRYREILDALAFDTVGEADERVPESYEETCDWILNATEEGEEESKLQRWLSTPGGSSIFWISGKPGSGKSTLMKYAFHDPKVRQCLAKWAEGGKLMMAAFYAHEGGNYVQKSREGIMRAVLYQTLTARSELIPICFPTFMSGPWPPATPFNTIVNLSQAFYQFFAHEASIFYRSREMGLPLGVEHWTNQWITYLKAMVPEALERDTNHEYTVDEYIVKRRLYIGAIPAYAAGSLHKSIPHEVWNHPHVEMLRNLSSDLIMVDNDIASWNKEQASGADRCNILHVVMKQLGFDFDGAMDWAVRLHAQLLGDFITGLAELPSFGSETDEHLRVYVEHLRHWPYAMVLWNAKSGRYFGSTYDPVTRTIPLLPKIDGKVQLGGDVDMIDVDEVLKNKGPAAIGETPPALGIPRTRKQQSLSPARQLMRSRSYGSLRTVVSGIGRHFMSKLQHVKRGEQQQQQQQNPIRT